MSQFFFPQHVSRAETISVPRPTSLVYGHIHTKILSVRWCAAADKRKHQCCPMNTTKVIFAGLPLTSVFSTNLLYAGMPKKTFSRKQAYADISVFLRLWRLPKIRPMAMFERKNLMEQLNPLLEWMLNEGWRRLSLLSSTCQHVATLQFDSRVMMAWT